MLQPQIAICFLVLIFISQELYAGKIINATLSQNSSVTNNARKTETNKITEFQNQIQLFGDVDYQNSNTEAKVNYFLDQYYFSENSQKDKFILQGQAYLKLFNQKKNATVKLSHTQRSLLNNINDVDLVSNRDERKIYTIEPEFTVGLSNVDAVIFGYKGEDIIYQYADTLNSRRLTSSVMWRHLLSENSSIIVSGLNLDVKFQDQSKDYHSQSITIRKLKVINKFSYNLMFGMEEFDRQEQNSSEDTTRLTYSLLIDYEKYWHAWSLKLERYVSDSSKGAGNAFEFNDVDSDAVADDIFLYEIYRGIAAWRYKGLCQQCTVAYNFIYQIQKNEELLGESIEFNHILTGIYAMTQRSSLNSTLRFRDQKIEEQLTTESFNQINIQIGYQYTLMKALRMDIASEYENRSDINYKELRIRVGFSYEY